VKQSLREEYRIRQTVTALAICNKENLIDYLIIKKNEFYTFKEWKILCKPYRASSPLRAVAPPKNCVNPHYC